METQNYTELKDYLTRVLKTAKKLGLVVEPNGGYSMGYDINNLPPYPVGLFGALSIVEGAGARCKLGLTYEQTESLESGFNGCFPSAQNKKKKKRRTFKPDMELMKVGAELTLLFQKQRPSGLRYTNTWDAADAPWEGAVIKAKPNPFGEPMPKKKKAVPAYIPQALEDKIAAKKKQIKDMMAEKMAQPAPQNEAVVEKIMELANAMAANKAVVDEIDGILKADAPMDNWAGEALGQMKMEAEWGEVKYVGKMPEAQQWQVANLEPIKELDGEFAADEEEG